MNFNLSSFTMSSFIFSSSSTSWIAQHLVSAHASNGQMMAFFDSYPIRRHISTTQPVPSLLREPGQETSAKTNVICQVGVPEVVLFQAMFLRLRSQHSSWVYGIRQKSFFAVIICHILNHVANGSAFSRSVCAVLCITCIGTLSPQVEYYCRAALTFC